MTKDERIAELEREVAEKDKEIDILTVGLQVANQYSEEIYNKYVKDNKKQLRHEICEKIREKVTSGGFNSTAKEFADGTYSKYKNWIFQILDQIERGEEV